MVSRMFQRRMAVGAMILLFVGVGCSGQAEFPNPRSVVIFSGERLQPDAERMEEADRWLRDHLDDIERNPSFLIELHRDDRVLRPWDALHIEGDTARIAMERGVADAETPFLLYAHFRLMAERSELEEWLPEAAEAEGFELERAIAQRISDAWLLGRSIYETQAYAPLDQLLYSAEFGYLEPYLVLAQTERFPELREEWEAEREDELEEFVEWFRTQFETDPPGLEVEDEDDGVR